jgi:hypothetical protein
VCYINLLISYFFLEREFTNVTNFYEVASDVMNYILIIFHVTADNKP